MSGPRIVAAEADDEQMLIDVLTGWVVELTLTPEHVIDIRVAGWEIGPDHFTWIKGRVWRPATIGDEFDTDHRYIEAEPFAYNWGELEQVRII